MALVGRRTERRDIPHEPNEWMEFRHLSGRQLRRAMIEAQNETRRGMNQFSKDVLEVQMSRVQDEDQERVERIRRENQRDLKQTYDLDTVLKHGVADWSYVDPVTEKKIDVNADNIAELDKPTEDWAFEEILRISGVEADDGAEKNGSKPSTDTSSVNTDGIPATISRPSLHGSGG